MAALAEAETVKAGPTEPESPAKPEGGKGRKQAATRAAKPARRRKQDAAAAEAGVTAKADAKTAPEADENKTAGTGTGAPAEEAGSSGGADETAPTLSAPRRYPKADPEAYSRIDRLGFEEFAAGVDGFSRLSSAIHRAVGLLPQADVITPENRETYSVRLAQVAERENAVRNSSKPVSFDADGKEIVDWRALARIAFWHVRRASGFGGSEVGTLLLNARGLPDPFTSAQRIVAQKLCMAAPDPGDEHTMRGSRAEDVIQTVYRRKFGVTADDDALSRVANFRPAKAPYLVGNPDDIVLDGAGARDLVDYKCPSPEMFEEVRRDGVPFGYRAQLHHYHTICASAGIAIDRMFLAPFRLMAFDAERFEVPYDREFAIEVARCARAMWHDHVMTGTLPEFDLGAGSLEGQPSRELLTLTARLGALSILKKSAEEAIQSLREDLSMVLLRDHRLRVGKYDLGVLNLSRREKWNEEELRAIAQAWNQDLSEFEKPKGSLDEAGVREIFLRLGEALGSGQHDVAMTMAAEIVANGLPEEKKLDCDAAARLMRDAGIDVTPAVEITDIVATTRKRKGDEVELLGDLQNLSQATASASISYIMARLSEGSDAFADIDLPDPQLVGAVPDRGEEPAHGPMLDEYDG